MFAAILAAGSLLYYKYGSTKIYTGELSLAPLPPSFESYGIDVSHHQGEIDWEVFKQNADSTIRFVYCKATEGTDFIDNKWKYNRTKLKDLKIIHGAYHFFSPSKSAKIQADHFLSQYSVAQNDLPPVLDAETEGASNSALIQNMKVWLNSVEEATGKRPIIYTSYHFYNTKFRNEFPGYKFWIANYSNTPNRLKDEAILHWQFSDKGKIPGIKGNVDLNFSRVNF